MPSFVLSLVLALVQQPLSLRLPEVIGSGLINDSGTVWFTSPASSSRLDLQTGTRSGGRLYHVRLIASKPVRAVAGSPEQGSIPLLSTQINSHARTPTFLGEAVGMSTMLTATALTALFGSKQNYLVVSEAGLERQGKNANKNWILSIAPARRATPVSLRYKGDRWIELWTLEENTGTKGLTMDVELVCYEARRAAPDSNFSANER